MQGTHNRPRHVDPPFSPGAAWRIIWPVAIVVIGIAVLIAVTVGMASAGASEDTVGVVATVVGSGVILIGAAILVAVLPPAQRRITVATKKRAISSVAIGLGLGCAIIVGAGIVIAAGSALDPAARQRMEDIHIPVGSAWWHAVLIVIALVLFAPIGEELLFRGLALRGIVRLVPFAVAAPLSGLLFTVAHVDSWLIWPRVLALLLTGWALAWIYQWRGLVGSVAAHATVNLVAAIALLAQL